MAKYAKRILIIFLIASVGYLVAKEFSADDHRLESAGNATTSNALETPADGTVFYYFHGYRRCPTCNAIERYSYEAVRSNFDEELKKGTLRLETINVETPENRHFINEFQLHSSGPVIVEYENGNINRYESLGMAWNLVRSKDKFLEYIKDKVQTFLDGTKNPVDFIDAPSAKDAILERVATIVDIRTPEEFKGGHISGAVNIPIEDFSEKYKELEHAKDSKIIIYCNTTNKVMRASQILSANGFKNVVVITGGIQAWISEGYPLSK